MRLLTILTNIVLGSHALLAQEKPEEPKDAKEVHQEAVIIPVKTLSGDPFNRLAKNAQRLQCRYVADDKLRTILVYAHLLRLSSRCAASWKS